MRTAADRSAALAVLHAFDRPLPDTIRVELPDGGPWRIVQTLHGRHEPPWLEDGHLHWRIEAPFSACVVHLGRDRPPA